MSEKMSSGEEFQNKETEREQNIEYLKKQLVFLDSLELGEDISVVKDETHMLQLFGSWLRKPGWEETWEKVSLLAVIGAIKEIKEAIKNHSEDQKPHYFLNLFHVAYRSFINGFHSNLGLEERDKEPSYLKILGRYFVEIDIASGCYGRARDNSGWIGETNKFQELAGKPSMGEYPGDANAMDIIRKANQSFMEEIESDPIVQMDKDSLVEKIKSEIKEKIETM